MSSDVVGYYARNDQHTMYMKGVPYWTILLHADHTCEYYKRYLPNNPLCHDWSPAGQSWYMKGKWEKVQLSNRENDFAVRISGAGYFVNFGFYNFCHSPALWMEGITKTFYWNQLKRYRRSGDSNEKDLAKWTQHLKPHVFFGEEE